MKINLVKNFTLGWVTIFSLLMAEMEPFRINVLSPGTAVFELVLDTVYVEEGELRIVPELPGCINIANNKIPAVRELFNHIPHDARVEIFFGAKRSLNFRRKVNEAFDHSKGTDPPFKVAALNSRLSRSHVNLYPAGKIKGIKTTVIEINPFRIDDEAVTWHKEMTIKLSWYQEDGHAPQRIVTKSSKNLTAKIKMPLEKAASTYPSFQFKDELIQVTLQEDGWYAITHYDLVHNKISLKGIDITTLKLWNKGRQVPLSIIGEKDASFDNDDIVIFYGTKARPQADADYSKNLYTDKNIYYLTWGGNKGLRYISEDGYPSLPPNKVDRPLSYQYMRIIEKNDIMVRLGRINTHQRWDTFDHYFMDPPINGGTSREFKFDLFYPKNINTKRFKFEAEFQGVTSGRHNIIIYLNGYKIASGSWNGQKHYKLTDDPKQVLLNNYLNHGENTLLVALEGNDPTNRYDQVYLNKLTVTYERLYKAVEDEIDFTRTSSVAIPTQFEITGFTSNNLLVFKETGTRIRDFVVSRDPGDKSYRIIFQDKPEDARVVYHAIAIDSLNSPDTMYSIGPLKPLAQESGRPYIIIGNDSMKKTIQPLTEYHNAVWVDIEDVYRQYSHGIMSPYAVKEFLSEAYYCWNIKPEFVLLAGEEIPSMYIQTVKWGAASSDYWYTLIDGNDLNPEFAIGRFPAADTDELEQMVSKTLDHHTKPVNTWKNNVLMIAGYEEIFKIQSESMINKIINNGIFPGRINIDLYSENTRFFGTTDSVIAHFDRGIAYGNFLGHGGGAAWGDRSLFTQEDVDLLSNSGKTPFITSMTCFTGDVQRENALGRRLMRYENGGVVGWFGSAGVGWIINDFLLLEPIQDILFTSNNLTIGEIINYAKIKYHATNVWYPDIATTQMYQFNLTGDPALKLRFPEKGSNLPKHFLSEPGGILSFSSSVDFDSLAIQIFDQERIPTTLYPVEPGENTYKLPDNIQAGEYDIAVFWKEGESAFRKNIPLSVNGPLVVIDSIFPSHPSVVDSIEVFAYVRSGSKLDSVQLWIGDEFHSDMINKGDEKYVLLKKIVPKPASTMQITCRIIDVEGNETISSPFSVDITDIPRFYIETLEMENSSDIGLKTAVRNSTTGYGKAFIEFQVNIDDNWERVGRDTIVFQGIQILEGFLKTPLLSGKHEYRAIVHGENERVNTDTLAACVETNAFWVTSRLGTTEDLAFHTTVHYGPYSLTVPPGIVAQNTILRLTRSEIPGSTAQPGLVRDDAIPGISIVSDNHFDVTLSTTGNNSSTIYAYYPAQDIWLLGETEATGDSIIVPFFSGGSIAFFTSSDTKKPVIKATVNGQNFYKDSYVNKNPEISIIASDKNGVDHRVSTFSYWINGTSTVLEPLFVNSKNGFVQIQLQPHFEETDSVFAITVKDANGNESEHLILNFIVASDLTVYDYGNFPNPFKDITRFSYELTEAVDKLTLEIFSVDGRRIRKLGIEESLTERKLSSGGYHELIWDGRTRSGDFVANGVYFYLLKAKKGKHVISRKGKIAKAR